jgi:hypothetical protein
VITLLEVAPPFKLYRVGSNVYNRLTPARKHAKLIGGTVEKWLPPEARESQGKCWEEVTVTTHTKSSV